MHQIAINGVVAFFLLTFVHFLRHVGLTKGTSSKRNIFQFGFFLQVIAELPSGQPRGLAPRLEKLKYPPRRTTDELPSIQLG